MSMRPVPFAPPLALVLSTAPVGSVPTSASVPGTNFGRIVERVDFIDQREAGGADVAEVGQLQAVAHHVARMRGRRCLTTVLVKLSLRRIGEHANGSPDRRNNRWAR